MNVRYAHTNIIGKDWRKLAHFYTRIFNCEFVPPERNQSGEWLEKATGVSGAALQGVHLRLPGHGQNGPTLEIFSYKEALEKPESAPNREGIGHLAFEVDDVDACLEAVIEAGGRALGQVVTRNIEGAGNIRFLYAADPEGNILELQHWS